MNHFIYEKGMLIRSYDFPGLKRKNCFVEGTIENVDPEEGILELKCTFDSLGVGKESRVGTMIMINIQSELDHIWATGGLKSYLHKTQMRFFGLVE